MRLSEHCYAVTGLAYTAPWSLNAGFIVGNETTLVIDTAATAMSAASVHGYAMAVRPGNRIAVLNTEKHFDHIGGNGYFRERGIDVFGHPGIRRTAAEFEAEVEEYAGAILDAARRAAGEARVFYAGTELTLPNRCIVGDTRMDLGGCVIEVLTTPGHTPTNVSVWMPEDAVLFCGDCLVNLYAPNLACGGVPEWKTWLASLNRIADLKAHAVVCGHGPVVFGEDVHRLIARVRGILERAVAAAA